MDSRLVKPKVNWVGVTQLRREAVIDYLQSIDALEFLEDIKESLAQGFSEGECLVSLLGKLCYKSLKVGMNNNITRVRDIADNVTQGIIKSAHGSVLEHVWLSFIVSDCSRVFTHELVRHRLCSFSQTSGRYVRLDRISCVWDDILDGCQSIFLDALDAVERAVYLMECQKGLRVPNAARPNDRPDTCFAYLPTDGRSWDDCHPDLRATYEASRWVPDMSSKLSFDYKKMVTSAIRRIAPNGIANEIGFSCNIRTLRHLLMLRTAPSSEWEIRYVFSEIYKLIRGHFPLFLCDAKERTVDGITQVYGMRTQPYELTPTEFLATLDAEDLEKELQRRQSLSST